MTRKLDYSKLKFSDKVVTTEEALKDVEPFKLDSNTNIKILQQKLNENMDKAVKLAEKNTIKNENGEVVFTKDEIDEMEDIIYKVEDKEDVRKAVEECSEKYNNTLKELADTDYLN